jgi:hypothetical protein
MAASRRLTRVRPVGYLSPDEETFILETVQY